MKRTAAALVIFAAGLAAQTGPSEKAMTLQDCILAALKNNLNLAAESLAPEVADAIARRAGEAFFPKLSFTVGKQNTNQASFSWLESADQVTTDFADYQGTLEQRLPTGATLSASLYSYRNLSNMSFQTINPRYGSTLTFDLSQPLLKDFGPKIARRGILVARNDQAISESELTRTLVETVYLVEAAYWNLVYDRETLKVRQDSLALARDLLAKNMREVEVGTLPPIEVLSARTAVASREADIIQAEAQVRNSQGILGKLINLPREKGAPAPVIVPTDSPGTGPVPLGLEEAETRALANRADLAAYRIDLETRGLNLSYARNQSLPSLNFRAAYWSPGLSGTQILYQDNDPLTGIIVGTVPGGPSMAFKDAFRFGQENWFVGLTFELPLGPVAARAQLTQAKLESEQALLRIGDLEQQILLEVETEVRAVETDHKRALAYQAARELAEETLAAEEKKLKAGMSTNYTVLMQQRDLALARTNEIKARVDYNLSLARLDRAMGTTLQSKNINLSGSVGR